MPDEREQRRKELIRDDWKRTVLEGGKWALVIWLLWPLQGAASGPINFTRVVLGILLFILFSGKLFYDTVVMGMIRQRRTTVRQDLMSLIGMVAGIAVVVGLAVMLVGLMMVQLFSQLSETGEQ